MRLSCCVYVACLGFNVWLLRFCLSRFVVLVCLICFLFVCLIACLFACLFFACVCLRCVDYVCRVEFACLFDVGVKFGVLFVVWFAASCLCLVCLRFVWLCACLFVCFVCFICLIVYVCVCLCMCLLVCIVLFVIRVLVCATLLFSFLD